MKWQKKIRKNNIIRKKEKENKEIEDFLKNSPREVKAYIRNLLLFDTTKLIQSKGLAINTGVWE